MIDTTKKQDEQRVDKELGPGIVPVLAGGGARLSAHIGILSALDELGMPYPELVGVSGGSIVAALRACGMSTTDIRRIALETDFSRFLGHNLWLLIKSGGLSSGGSFERWMGDMVGDRCLGDLERDLHVVATDVMTGKAVVFSSRSTPDMPVAEAVRCSMSVPLLFSFKHRGEQVLTDGSILSEEALRRDWSGRGTPVVVFKLRGNGGFNMSRRSAVPLRDYLGMLIHTFMTSLSHEYVNDAFWLSTIIVETGDVSPVAFSLDAKAKDRLFELGYSNTMSHLPRKLMQRVGAGDLDAKQS